MFRESQASPSAVCCARWIAEARNGSRPALDQLFQACSPYLLAVANREFSSALRSRLDPGDVVQDTLLKAWQRFAQFRGETESDLLAWLRQILLHNLANAERRHLRTAMRAIRREITLDPTNTKQPPDYIDCDAETPSTPMQKQEQHDALQTALAKLPEHYRQVLQLHSQEGMTFSQLGTRLRCTAEAVRKLWGRAAEQLARLLRDAGKS